MHPVAVAAHSVDLAIVDHIPVRVRPLPTGKGIGAETRMHQRNRRLETLVYHIEEITLDLVGD